MLNRTQKLKFNIRATGKSWIFLYINTAVDNVIELALIDRRGRILDKVSQTVGIKQAEKLLPLMVLLLKRHNFLLKNLRGLVVVSGPGRFTSLRIGIATANTIALALNIPVIGINLVNAIDKINFKKVIRKTRKGRFVVPLYDKEPNITKAKK